MKSAVRLFAILSGLTLVGVLGFRVIEGAPWLDCLYMTVITLTTVGYSETIDLSANGKIFVVCYLGIGTGVFLYSIVQLGELVLRAELRSWLERRRKHTAMKSLEDHFIVCGIGRMGKTICRQLAERNLPFVVIEKDEEAVAECKKENWNWVNGDATDDRVLEEAGLKRARGLAAVLGSDSDNLYIVMSARLVCPKLLILARAEDDSGVYKMEKAGANRVISLYSTGASKIVQLLASPKVEDFIELIKDRDHQMDLAEVHMCERTRYVGQTLAESDLRSRGLIVIGIRRQDGESLMPPPSSARIEEGDALIALGARQAIRDLIDALE